MPTSACRWGNCMAGISSMPQTSWIWKVREKNNSSAFSLTFKVSTWRVGEHGSFQICNWPLAVGRGVIWEELHHVLFLKAYFSWWAYDFRPKGTGSALRHGFIDGKGVLHLPYFESSCSGFHSKTLPSNKCNKQLKGKKYTNNFNKWTNYLPAPGIHNWWHESV